MALPGSEVQSVGNSVTVGLSDRQHGYLFGNVLANQSVEVLIASAFPRVVGSGEVALQRELEFKLFVAMELSSVVEGDRLEAGLVFFDGVQSGLGDRGGSSRLELLDDSKAGFSFNERENAVMEITADHCVPFPVTELQTGFDGRRPLRDMSLAWQNSA